MIHKAYIFSLACGVAVGASCSCDPDEPDTSVCDVLIYEEENAPRTCAEFCGTCALCDPADPSGGVGERWGNTWCHSAPSQPIMSCDEELAVPEQRSLDGAICCCEADM